MTLINLITMNIVIIYFVINIIMIIVNLIKPFLNYKDESSLFESITLFIIGSVILTGMIVGFILRLFIREKEDIVVIKNKK